MNEKEDQQQMLKAIFKEEVVPDTLQEAKESTGGGLKKSSLAGGRRGSISDLSLVRPLGRARSRSQSRSRMGTSKSSLNLKY